VIRIVGILGAALAGFAGWKLWQARSIPPPPPPMEPPAEAIAPDDLPFPPPMLDPPAAPVTLPAGILSPADIVALLPQADPDGLLHPAEVLAFCFCESGVSGGFNPRAYRWEAHLGEASFGLMQVLASTARDRGFPDPEALYDPVIGLRAGILHADWGRDFLRQRLGGEPSRAQWVGAYNMGVGNVLRGRLPLGYIQKWEAAYGRFIGA
jgi:hypothetical protein